jgi:hypothetical protein
MEPAGPLGTTLRSTLHGVSSNLEPSGVEYFKIECGCKGSPAADHDSFKLKITNAY